MREDARAFEPPELLLQRLHAPQIVLGLVWSRGDGHWVLPLDGVRVVDLTSSLAGPYCTEILAALGADVVKIEHPQRGDESRAWGCRFTRGSVMFYAANLGKRSLALDLKRGRDVLLRLVDTADVFLQPATGDGLAARLRGRSAAWAESRLVYCDIGAFGRAGPLRERPGYDPLLQAYGGLISVTGEPDRPGVRIGASVVDQGTGMWAALGILAALHAGGGRMVDVSLFETVVGLLPYQVTAYLKDGRVPGREGTAFPLIAPYQVLPRKVADSQQTAALGLIQPLAEPRVAFPISFDDEEIESLAAQGVVGRVTSAS